MWTSCTEVNMQVFIPPSPHEQKIRFIIYFLSKANFLQMKGEVAVNSNKVYEF